MGVDSIAFSEVAFDDDTIKNDSNRKAFHCPAGGRIGYDFDSLKECCNCETRGLCLQTAAKIEEEFK